MRLINKLSKRFNTVPEKQQGQAIVLIAITGLVLLAFVGLAIDGGRLYFLKRDTQSAADAGGLAAARAMCTLRDYEVAGFNAVEANGFSNDNTADFVDVYSPPQHSKTEIAPECEGCFVEVEVSRQIPPSFTQLVFDGPLEATSYSVAMCNPDTTYGLNASGLRAMWTKSNSCQNSLDFTGSSNYIFGGVHSNYDIHSGASGGGATVVGPVSYVHSLDVPDGKITWLTEDDTMNNNQYTVSGACDISCFLNSLDDDQVYPWQNPYQVDEPINDYPLEHTMADYRPGGPVATEEGSNYHVYDGSCKGNEKELSETWLQDNGYMTGNTIDPGVYYSPCDIKFNSVDGLNGNVTLVAEGTITFSNSNTNVTAYRDDLLAFTEAGGESCNSKVIKFSGSTNTWVGNMFAPNGKIEMSASSNTTTEGCLVAYAIDLSGSATSLVCDPEVGSEKSPAISLDN